MTKEALIEKLYNRYRKEYADQEVVLGDGNINSRLLLIGEAPGKDEVKQGKPFVGAAGKNLAEFLEMLELDRSTIYITNAIKFRLSKLNPTSGRLVNRPSTKEEVQQNRQYLLEEIDIIHPETIVTLGNVPLRAVVGENGISIGAVHGEMKGVQVRGEEYSLFPLYHPASIIYTRSLKDVYKADVLKLKSILDGK